ncbi:hypothetical protein [Mycolicibacterium sp. CBMA 226]|uniref:hypothetical protein n=1 Tax=Mycolicibacterium sp. CBMA 226 TaxID=2606611 RepID=UPI0012DD5302|nr:hypothetical protein [Mycolicibacterium sp. CBMA 226]MUL78775.1 hypothetical protein [Mycolicibacterium sp. CBMA 226]QGW61067.1 hypothetical protein ICEMyc226_00035 [Mycolicibacterium sp.]
MDSGLAHPDVVLAEQQAWVDDLFAEETSPVVPVAPSRDGDGYGEDYVAPEDGDDLPGDSYGPPDAGYGSAGAAYVDQAPGSAVDETPVNAPPVDLDAAPGVDAPPVQWTPPSDGDAGAKRTLLWLASGVALVAVLIILAFCVFGGGPDKPAVVQHHSPLVPIPSSAAPGPAAMPVPQQDVSVPFTATTDSCTPQGSTSPQALTDTTTDSAWVCVRGTQESYLDGQILNVRFTCATSRPESNCSYMLNSLSVTPGWVAKTPGGKDQWLGHRVARLLQFNFYNGDQLAAAPFAIDTGDVHGPYTVTLPSKVLASRVDVIIKHTERPPVAPLPPAGAPAGGAANPSDPGAGLGLPGPDSATPTTDSAPPVDPGDPSAAAGTDPADATFAMSQMQFFGHAPN